ncbi:ATP-dependent DNA helicase RecG [Miltoncostaea marina]|uniref:ATP-dependent DNA helicase RecG n=1 Tax=Miltoncostaea marina TaxID=2843215 RepID=UPI001C3E581B|nr:ATP-dependent DNA helicase RecG [Miltoncostaea marina]
MAVSATSAHPPASPLPPLGSRRGDPRAPMRPRPPGPGRWSDPVTALPGVGPTLARRLRSLGVEQVGQLLEHLPARYESFDAGARPVSALRAGEEATVRVVLDSIAVRPTRRRGLRIVSARVHDATGRMGATWFNQQHLARVLQPGDELLLRGRVGTGGRREIAVRSHEVLGGPGSEGLHTTGLVPVYPATEAMPVRRIRELIDLARPLARAAPERLPARVRHRLGLPGAADALVGVHFPRSRAEARLGRRRMVVEELVVLQLGLLAVRRAQSGTRAAPPLEATGERSGPLLAALPFRLTAPQRRAAREVGRDLARPVPMRRLLQGEVGSGKTLVAVLAICQAVEAGAQAAVLVPTETLAEQHLRTLDAVLAPAGLAPVLLTGRVTGAERERRLLALRSGTAPIAVGTQALLSEGVAFHRLGLVVVDEQHRFGVEQRQALAERAAAGGGGAAHLLYMTATPIPRTLALTAYGDLTVSTIRSRPPGRSPVETRWVREADRDEAYELVRAQLRAGRQAYVICPLVEEGAAAEARAATTEAERLREGPFADFRVGLLHGALSADAKRAAMVDFAEGRIDLLVATTVVEVGIDVPNATTILIEDADRFGLAQLHQLRGRVGRGEHAGTCILFGEPPTEDGARRLEAVTQTSDGFRLAELDLEIRGEGSILGLRQAGPTDLRFARLSRDRRELAEARWLARRALRDDPHLERPEHRLLRDAVLQRFDHFPRLLDA